MKLPANSEGNEFYPFLRGPSSVALSSRELGWNGLLLERHRASSGERPEAVGESYILALVCGNPWVGEYRNGRGSFVSNPNYPGTITLIAPGVVPAIRTKQPCDHVLCAVRPTFLASVEDELDKRPSARPGTQGGLQDPALRQLLRLLNAEAKQGGPTGRLYADSLGHALATRLLFLGGVQERDRPVAAPLPSHLLRRTFERMEDLNADLDLSTLAAASGYSRGHFLRMFRAAVGCTPHHYVLQARVKRAQELVKAGRMSLIDIAAACGFSNHAHMTRTFRQLLNVTPSEYRRHL